MNNRKKIAGDWMLKFLFCFMEKTHETLHLDKWSLEQWKTMHMSASFIWISTLFDVAFDCGDGVKSEVMLEERLNN
jgi:hypothetical protein